jgi:hypothetical protein
MADFDFVNYAEFGRTYELWVLPSMEVNIVSLICEGDGVDSIVALLCKVILWYKLSQELMLIHVAAAFCCSYIQRGSLVVLCDVSVFSPWGKLW